MQRSVIPASVGLSQIGFAFLKIGFIFFGGGFVLIPVIHREIVQQLHWLTEREFLDGLAISQLTPGPVAVLATFCGFRQGGVIGALIATVAVFTPAFIFMVSLSHGYGILRKIESVRQVLNRLIPAIVGLLVASAVEIAGQASVVNPVGFALFSIALFLMIRFKMSPALLIGAGAVVGLIFHL